MCGYMRFVAGDNGGKVACGGCRSRPFGKSRLAKSGQRAGMNRLIAFLIACGMAMAAGCSTGLTPGQVKDVLRQAYQTGQWLDSVQSFHVRWETTWQILPEWVHATGQKLHKRDSVCQWAFDKERVAILNKSPDRSWSLRRDPVSGRAQADTAASPNLHGRAISLGWLGYVPHRFWWYLDSDIKSEARREQAVFDYAGRELFRGVDCYVLEKRNEGKFFYIAVSDRRLRGVKSLAFFEWAEHGKLQVWNDLARENGRSPGDPKRPSEWTYSLPEAKRKAVHEAWHQRTRCLLRVDSVCYLEDYREVAPGCFMPMFMEETSYIASDENHTYEHNRRTSKVTEVRVDQPVPWDQLNAQYHFDSIPRGTTRPAAKAADPKLVDELADAIARGRVDRVKKLLKSNPELVWGRVRVPPYGPNDSTPLHLAASQYYRKSSILGFDTVSPPTPDFQARLLQIAQALLDAGADINATAGGLTPLHVTIQNQVRKGWIGMADLLLGAGANPNISGPYGTPLYVAVEPASYDPQVEARIAVIKALLEHGADPCITCGFFRQWPYERAVELKEAKVAQVLAKPTWDKADAEYATLQDVIARWAKATVEDDKPAIAALTADDPMVYPHDWTARAAKLRESYAGNLSALGTIISRHWWEPWAYVQVAGPAKNSSLLLTLMRFPDGKWRIVHGEETEWTSTDLARIIHHNYEGLFGSYRAAVLDAAGVLPMPRPGQQTGGDCGAALGRLDISVRGEGLILAEYPFYDKCPSYKRFEVELAPEWVKFRTDAYYLATGAWLRYEWKPGQGSSVVLTASDGRAVLTKGGKEIQLERDGSRVQATVNGKTITADRLVVDGTAFSIAPATPAAGAASTGSGQAATQPAPSASPGPATNGAGTQPGG